MKITIFPLTAERLANGIMRTKLDAMRCNPKEPSLHVYLDTESYIELRADCERVNRVSFDTLFLVPDALVEEEFYGCPIFVVTGTKRHCYIYDVTK